MTKDVEMKRCLSKCNWVIFFLSPWLVLRVVDQMAARVVCFVIIVRRSLLPAAVVMVLSGWWRAVHVRHFDFDLRLFVRRALLANVGGQLSANARARSPANLS